MMGEGDHDLADTCRLGGVEIVGTVELVCVDRLLRMSFDSFLMSVCGSIGGGESLWEQNELPLGNILLRTNGRGGRGGEEVTESLIL